MLVCFIAGFIVGLVCEHIVRGHMRKIDAEFVGDDGEDGEMEEEMRNASTISRDHAAV